MCHLAPNTDRQQKPKTTEASQTTAETVGLKLSTLVGKKVLKHDSIP